MREVRETCVRCGRTEYLEVDVWSAYAGEQGRWLCGHCRRGADATPSAAGRDDSSRTLGVGTVVVSFAVAGLLFARHAGLL